MRKISEEDYQDCIKLTNLYAPKILPPNYCSIPGPFEGQLAYQDTSGLLVTFLEVGDCQVRARIHQTDLEGRKQFILKIKLLRTVVNEFLEHLEA